MKLKQYFENQKGTGVLATADREGRVDAALYARPHFMEDGTIAFIARDRLTHHNLQSNPYAAYLFVEDGRGYKGKRLFLKKVGEEKETERLYELKRREYVTDANTEEDPKYLMFFSLEKVLSLVGGQEEPIE
jgi:hypothetical protein